MSDRNEDDLEGGRFLNAGDDLRQALMRLTSPQVVELQDELIKLRAQIADLEKLRGNTTELQKKLSDVGLMLNDFERKFALLSDELRDPAKIEQRLETTVVPSLHKQVIHRSEDVAETLAPVIGPAIRRQIRDAKDDIIDALYPVIGLIINKAISEALRELTRSIDTRLRQQLNFRDRLNQTLARLRGVSEAELLLRDSLPYSIERVFLVHRETGLLLSHIEADSGGRGEMDTISGMLTAIQDFVRDSFSGGEGELEEITHGNRRILLEAGQRAYGAVVLQGVEPEGYNRLIRDAVSTINVKYENELKKFDGTLERMPDFRVHLRPLLDPGPVLLTQPVSGTPLSRPQKRIIGFTAAGLLLLIGLLVFACFFMIRLWPFAFPAAALPVATTTPSPVSTPTPLPTSTVVPSPTQTATAVPTLTFTVQPPSPTPVPIGVLTGNLNVRAEPSFGSPALGVVVTGEKVLIRDRQDIWYLIAWPIEGEPILEGWINGNEFLVLPPGQSP